MSSSKTSGTTKITAGFEQTQSPRGVFYLEGLENLFSNVPVVLYHWTAPDRIAYRKPLALKGMLAFIALVLGLYFWWVGQPLMSLAVVAIFYLYYLIISVSPLQVKHVIYSNGFFSIDRLYPWENLVDFWFANLDGRYVLYINTNLNFPGRLVVLVPDRKQMEEIALILGQFLPYANVTTLNNRWARLLWGDPITPDQLVLPEDLLYNKDQLQKYIMQIIKKAQKSFKGVENE